MSMAAAETLAEVMDRYGRPNGSYPVIDLDAVDQQRQTVIVSFAGGTKKAIVQFTGLAAGTSTEHLCLDVHAFVDEVVARSSVFGLEDGTRFEGFTDDAPGRSQGRPAVRGVTVLIGVQTPATVPAGSSSAFDADELEALVITAAEAVGSGMAAVSRRQRDLAMRAYQLLGEALGD
jgi:hypothetical protein